MNELIEQSITMLGEVFNSVSYHMHIQTLSCLLNDFEAKRMRKEKASIKSFQSDLYQTLKTQRKYQKVIRKETAKKQNKPRQLFWRGQTQWQFLVKQLSKEFQYLSRVSITQQENISYVYLQPRQTQMLEILRMNFENVHSTLKKLFKGFWGLRFFRHNWELLTSDQIILDIILG